MPEIVHRPLSEKLFDKERVLQSSPQEEREFVLWRIDRSVYAGEIPEPDPARTVMEEEILLFDSISSDLAFIRDFIASRIWAGPPDDYGFEATERFARIKSAIENAPLIPFRVLPKKN